MALKVMHVLNMEPKNGHGHFSESCLALWRTVRRNSFELILKHWSLVELLTPLFDAKAVVDTWEVEEQMFNGKSTFTGLRRGSKMHGIVRGVTHNG